MKLSFYIYKLLFFAVLLGAVQNSYAQTPKEIKIPLELAKFIGINICDSYTLSFFIKEEENGKPIYNNGLLTQDIKNGKMQSKRFRNQKISNLFDKAVQIDTIMLETIQKTDTIYKYNNKALINISDVTKKYEYISHPRKYYTIIDTLITSQEELKQSNQRQLSEKEIIQNYKEKNFLLYREDSYQNIVFQDTLSIDTYNGHKPHKYKGSIVLNHNNTISIEYRIQTNSTDKEKTFFIIYTLGNSNYLQSFTVYQIDVKRDYFTIENGILEKVSEDFNLIANVIFLCN